MKNESNIGNSQRVVRAARLLVLSASVIGFIGATASPAAASCQETHLKGSPGGVMLMNYRAAEGGICGAVEVNPSESSNCTDNFNWIFIDRFFVSTAPYAVPQTIKVDEYLYQWNGQFWTLAIAIPRTEFSPSSVYLGWYFGSPAPDVNAPCSNWGGCRPTFVYLPRGKKYSYTVVVKISWLDSSTGNVLAQANYIPGTDFVSDIGCALRASNSFVNRCTNVPGGTTYTSGLPTDKKYVGYIIFP